MICETHSNRKQLRLQKRLHDTAHEDSKISAAPGNDIVPGGKISESPAETHDEFVIETLEDFGACGPMPPVQPKTEAEKELELNKTNLSLTAIAAAESQSTVRKESSNAETPSTP